jgi:hypothetical protein
MRIQTKGRWIPPRATSGRITLSPGKQDRPAEREREERQRGLALDRDPQRQCGDDRIAEERYGAIEPMMAPQTAARGTPATAYDNPVAKASKSATASMLLTDARTARVTTST